jgi:hypothetical protein
VSFNGSKTRPLWYAAVGRKAKKEIVGKISDLTWFVNVTDCKGRVVEWCGRRYAGIPARCGHVEIELPPGCYIVSGAKSFAVAPPFLYLNYITHFSMVEVGCDEKACVHLYAPTYRLCWRFLFFATQVLAQLQGIPREKTERLTAALNDVLPHVPATAQDAELERLFEEVPKMREPEEEGKKPK